MLSKPVCAIWRRALRNGMEAAGKEQGEDVRQPRPGQKILLTFHAEIIVEGSHSQGQAARIVRYPLHVSVILSISLVTSPFGVIVM